MGKLIDGAMSAVTGPVKDMAQLGLGFNDLKENATLAFGVILKDGEKAKKLFEDLAKFGKESPIFNTGEMIRYAQQLLPITGPGPELFDALKGIGAATAATGRMDRMSDIFLAFTQVARKPKLSSEEMSQQLAEAGVDAWGLLARGLGRSPGEVMEMSAAGRLSGIGSFKVMMAQALREFGPLVDLMGQTRTGKQAQIDDTMEQLAGRGTVNLHGTWKGVQDQMLQSLHGPKGGQLADQINSVTGDMGGLLLGGLNDLMDGSFLTKMQKVGEDAKRGISQGFEGVKTGVGNAIEYVTGFKTGIGSNSPAKEFIPLGQYAAQGFLIGFEAEMMAAGAPMSLFQSKGGQRLGSGQAERRAENERLLGHPAIQAMIDAIGVGEGTFDPKTGKRNFNAWFGNARLNPSAEHPGISPVPFFNKKTGRWDRSSAAGVGQFIRGTWSGVEDDIGDLDFNNPHHQLLAFVEKMRDRGMIKAILGGDIRKAMALGNEEWASLPGSPHKQPTVKESTVLDTFNKQLGVYTNGTQVTRANPMPVTIIDAGNSVAVDPKTMRPFAGATGNENLAQAQAEAARIKQTLDKFPVSSDEWLKRTNNFMRDQMIAAGRSPEEVEKLLAATDKKTTITENKAIPGLEKLGDAANLTAEQIEANRKLAEMEGPAKKKKRDPLFDSAFTREGIAGDFHGGLSSLLGNIGWGGSAKDLGKQFLFNLARDAQGRMAHDLSSMITGSIFGSRGEDGKLTGGLFGGKGFDLGSIFSKLFGGLFGGFRASGGSMSAGRFYLAGENGPEFVSGPGYVHNAKETKQMMGGGGGGTQVFFALGDRAVEDMNNHWYGSRSAMRKMIKIQGRYGKLLRA